VETFIATVYVAGELSEARQTCREFCEEGLCVTVTPTTFIYTGGAEEGVAVGLVNYPRFPSTPEQITDKACRLARLLSDRLYQRTALVVTTTETIWIKKEEPIA